MSELTVCVSNETNSTYFCESYSGTGGRPKTVDIDCGNKRMVGNVLQVRVRSQPESDVILCEVEVYGSGRYTWTMYVKSIQ